jgi:hypothetical protein
MTVAESLPAPAPATNRFDPRVVAWYLDPITRYGYPPPAEGVVDGGPRP